MKKKGVLSIVLAAVLTFTLGVSAMATNSNGGEQVYAITEPYSYDVLPGTDEWEAMTLAERYEACYVSADVAKNMTTQALVETVLEYPFWVNVYAFDTLKKGIDMVSSYFPPLVELLEREDAANALNEYIASRPVYLQSEEGEVDLKSYGAESLKIMIGNEVETMTAVTAVEPHAAKRTVKTPNGTSVDVIDGLTWADVSASFGQQINYDIALAQSKNALSVYPGSSIVRNPSPQYNCHSYAWYSTSSNNTYWMNDPSAYMDDGSYVSATAAINNRVTYKNNKEILHSGITTAMSGGPVTVTSKWGALAVFKHDVDKCPYVPSYNPDVGSVIVGSWKRA